MSTHIYAFGSVCRGEVDFSSDIDLLACLSMPQQEYDPEKFSIYSHDRIQELWLEGNPFSWHLYLESKLIYSSDNSDFISDLGKPLKYSKALEDCTKFNLLFLESYQSLTKSNVSAVFHLSCMFLATRNFATCYSLGAGKPIFSRQSPLQLHHNLNKNCRSDRRALISMLVRVYYQLVGMAQAYQILRLNKPKTLLQLLLTG